MSGDDESICVPLDEETSQIKLMHNVEGGPLVCLNRQRKPVLVGLLKTVEPITFSNIFKSLELLNSELGK